MRENQNFLFWFLIGVLTASFLILKLFDHNFISWLYHQNFLELLNALANSTSKDLAPLTYYLGKIENNALGPAKSLLSGSIFLLIAWRYFYQAPLLKFAAAVFVYLLLSRPEVLLYPPYGESITGPFSDATWLFRHNLNYYKLLQQDTFAQWGVQIYPLSIYPFFLALLMTLTQTPPVFLITIHLLVFIMGAFIIALTHEVSAKIINKEAGLLTAVLFLSWPLFQSMVELINLEIPNLFFAMFAIYYLSRRQFGWAAFNAVLSLLVKIPGIVACAVVFAAALILFLSDSSKDKREEHLKNLAYGALAVMIGILVGYFRNKIIGDQPINNKLSIFIGWASLKSNVWFWSFVWMLFFFIAHLDVLIFRNPSQNKIASFIQIIKNHFEIILIFIFNVIWFLMYLNFSTMAYRYEFLMIGFVIICGVYIFYLFLPWHAARRWAFVFLILFTFACSHGLAYKIKDFSALPNPTELERSLEYHNYLKAEMLTVKEITEYYADHTIGAPYGMAQTLFFPELGYVNQKLDVMQYGMGGNLDIKSFEGLKHLDLNKTIWIGYTFDVPPGGISIPYPYDPKNDFLVKKITYGDSEVLLFKGGFSIEKLRLVVKIFQMGLWDEFKKNGQINPALLNMF